MMQNPFKTLAEKRGDLRRISEKIAEAGRKGIELGAFAKELFEKEEVLAKSEAKYKALAVLIEAIVDNIPDFIWAKDLERRYLFSNKALRELFKLRNKEDLLGKTQETLITISVAAGYPVNMQDIKIEKTGRTNGSDIYIKQGTCNGTFFAWQVHRAPLKDEQGEVIGTVSVARDVTDEYKEII